MKKILAWILAACMVLALAGCGGSPASTPANSGAAASTPDAPAAPAAGGIFNVGTGSTGGADNVVVEAISSVVNQKTEVKASTVTTNGGTEIVYLLETGDIQAGYAGTVDLADAVAGKGAFDHAVDEAHLCQMFGFATWNLPMLVLDTSDIQSYEDLAGKRVGLSPVGSSTAAVLQMVFDAYGLTDSITIENYTWSEGYGALKDGRIDAFVGSWTNGNPISGIIELEATNKIRVLDMDPAIGEAAHGMNAGVSYSTLSHENDENIPEGAEVTTPTNSAVLICNADVDEETVYQYVKCVLENVDDLRAISNNFDAFEDVCVEVCVESVPFHPGAARALKEAGLWKDSFKVYGE